MDMLSRGMKIKTAMLLGSTAGMFIGRRNLDSRCPSADGILLDYVLGHGGDVWFVSHADGQVAAYSISEMCLTGETASETEWAALARVKGE